MSARLPTHNDLPSFECKLGRDELLKQVAHEIAEGTPPLVFGVHGDWGSGKTSFLCQLENELSGRFTLFPEVQRTRLCQEIDNVFAVWFEAWRSQHEPAPAVALLQEICRQLPNHAKVKEVLQKWGGVITKGFFGAVDELSLELQAIPGGVGGKAGLKVKNPVRGMHEAAMEWDQEHLRGRLTTDHVRKQLEEVILKLLGDDKRRRVCVIIDDLDRCDPVTALRILEAVKVHFSVPQCVFVLGVNQRQIEQAIAPLLPGAKERAGHDDAAEYLEKLCTFTWKLPFLAPSARAALLKLCLADPPNTVAATATPLPERLRDRLAATAEEFDCLPANPRKIKALANTIRHLAARGWGMDAVAEQDLAIPEEEADALLISASIYHFHPDMLRYLQTTPHAWTELLLWANNKSLLSEKSDLYSVLHALRPLTIARPDAEKGATPSPVARTTAFTDPIHLSVFRIEDLLRDATDPRKRDSVTYDSMRRYLDFPKFRTPRPPVFKDDASETPGETKTAELASPKP